MSQDRELDGTTYVRYGNRRASEVEDETRALIAHSYAALYDYGIGYSVPAKVRRHRTPRHRRPRR